MASVKITGFGLFKNLKNDPGVQETTRIINEALREEAGARLIKITEDNAQLMAKRVSTIINKEMLAILPFIASNLFGTKNGAANIRLGAQDFGVGKGANPFGLASTQSAEVIWESLTYQYHKRKRKRGQPNFFVFSGALQKYFENEFNSTEFAARLGGCQIAFQPGTSSLEKTRTGDFRQVKLGTLEIALVPSRRISRGRFGETLAEGTVQIDPTNRDSIMNPAKAKQFDKSMFSSAPQVWRKLINSRNNRSRTIGARRPYRPVVQPAVAIWMLQRIPAAISKVIRSLR